MTCVWAVKGGVGTSVVAAGLAVASSSATATQLVDLAGDQPRLVLGAECAGVGIAEWLRAGVDVPADALVRLQQEVLPGLSIVPRGSGPLCPGRAPLLAALLEGEAGATVVDAGRLAVPGDEAALALARAAHRSLLVTRACPLSLRHLSSLPVAPSAVIVVRDHRRAVSWRDVAHAAGAPVVAEVDVDPAVGAAVDASLVRQPFPRSFLRVLGAIA